MQRLLLYLRRNNSHTRERPRYVEGLVICSGIIPADWKSATVTPIHKEHCRMNPNDYRPISVSPVIAKYFKKAFSNQTYIYDFLSENKLLSDLQSGFRPLHSALTALLDIMVHEKWLQPPNRVLETLTAKLNFTLIFCLFGWGRN